jgi:hypothetical protein
MIYCGFFIIVQVFNVVAQQL